MNSNIAQYLFKKDLLQIGERDEINSICDLISVELENDNFEKTLALSEETIKLNSKAPVGWLIKAISELQLMDKKEDFLGNSIKSMKKCLSLSSDLIETNIEIKSIFESIAIIKFSQNIGTDNLLSTFISIGKWLTEDAIIPIAENRFKHYDENVKNKIFDKNYKIIEQTLPLAKSLIEMKKSVSPDIIAFIDNAVKTWLESIHNIILIEYNNLLLSFEKKINTIVLDNNKLINFINNQCIIPEFEKILIFSELIGLSNSKFYNEFSSLYSEIKSYFGKITNELIEKAFKTSKDLGGFGCGLMIVSVIVLIIASSILGEGEFPIYNVTAVGFFIGFILLMIKRNLKSQELETWLTETKNIEANLFKIGKPTINDVNESKIGLNN